MRILVTFFLIAVIALPADLPVRQVVLYKHGVGFFERSGQLGPGESARLDFKAAEMNDVLKSLMVTERGGGKVSGLRYDSSLPISQKLGEFPFRIDKDQPLAAVLDQLKGARVEVKFGSDMVTGSIISGRVTAASDKTPEREQLTLLLDSGEMRTYDLSASAGLRFTDAQVQSQFRDYLTALTASRSMEKRSVYIDSTDAKGRQVEASYTIPMPVWKSTYRLLFEGAQPVLEGWAIVDNTTGEDWTKVSLSLVSGRPISFISSLYEPKYVNRPTAELPDDAAQRPVLHEGGYAAGALGGYPPPPPPAAAAAPRSTAMARMQPSAGLVEMEQLGAKAEKSTILAPTGARELGELFEYRIGTPVTIRKNESAMLPFLQDKVQGRKLLIYSNHASPHPTNAVEIANSTGKTLDGGPITVYDSGAYAGEALMETLKSGDKRLISYAVDLGTRITEAFDSKAAIVRELHARRGILTTRTASEEVRTYTIRNVDQKPKTLLIEHPLRPDYTLLGAQPAEKTSTVYRFEIKLPAGGTEKFPVAEERVYDSSFALTNITPDVILTYTRNKTLSDAARKQLERIAALKTEISETSRSAQDIESQIRNVTSDEERVRRNMESLNNVSGQQQQTQAYARQLGEMETRLASLRDQQSELQKKRAGLETDLNRAIDALSF